MSGPDRAPETDALEDRIADLEAAVAALEAYVGRLERVDDELERRANAAITAVAQHQATDLDPDAFPATAELPARDSEPDLDELQL